MTHRALNVYYVVPYTKHLLTPTREGKGRRLCRACREVVKNSLEMWVYDLRTWDIEKQMLFPHSHSILTILLCFPLQLAMCPSRTFPSARLPCASLSVSDLLRTCILHSQHPSKRGSNQFLNPAAALGKEVRAGLVCMAPLMMGVFFSWSDYKYFILVQFRGLCEAPKEKQSGNNARREGPYWSVWSQTGATSFPRVTHSQLLGQGNSAASGSPMTGYEWDIVHHRKFPKDAGTQQNKQQYYWVLNKSDVLWLQCQERLTIWNTPSKQL